MLPWTSLDIDYTHLEKEPGVDLCYTCREMEEKTLKILEYSKVIDKLAGYASFSASADLALQLKPLVDSESINKLQKQTGEALLLTQYNRLPWNRWST